MVAINKFTKVLGVTGLLAVSGQMFAGEAIGTIRFGTIQDVGVQQVTALHFGDNYLLGSGLTCNVAYTGQISTVDTKLAAQVADAARTGTACGTIAASANSIVGGLFLIEGAASQAVKVTVSGATENDLLFEPAGNVVPGDPLVAAKDALTAGDIAPFIDGNETNVKLSIGVDAFGNDTGKGFASIYVGGQLTTQADLANSANLSVTYNVEVVY